MLKFKINKTAFLTAYESAANVDSTEIIIKLTPEFIQFQAYNSSSTYLVNTYLKNLNIGEQLNNLTTFYKLRYIPNLFTNVGKDLQLTIDNSQNYNFLFRDQFNQTISLDYIELNLDTEEFLSELEIANTKVIKLNINETVPLLKNLLILQKVDSIIHMYTKDKQLVLVAKNIMNGLQRTVVLDTEFENFNYTFKMDKFSRQILKSVDPIYEINIYPEHNLIIYSKQNDILRQNYIVAVE